MASYDETYHGSHWPTVCPDCEAIDWWINRAELEQSDKKVVAAFLLDAAETISSPTPKAVYDLYKELNSWIKGTGEHVRGFEIVGYDEDDRYIEAQCKACRANIGVWCLEGGLLK